MLTKFLSGKHIKPVSFALLGCLLISGAFFGGSLLESHSSQSGNTSQPANTAQQPQITPLPANSPLSQQAANGLGRYLDYLKATTSNPQQETITDYKFQSIESSYQKGMEIHTTVIFSVRPDGATSQENLLADGGTLQNDGWITDKKAYVELKQKGTAYILKVISFSPLPDF